MKTNELLEKIKICLKETEPLRYEFGEEYFFGFSDEDIVEKYTSKYGLYFYQEFSCYRGMIGSIKCDTLNGVTLEIISALSSDECLDQNINYLNLKDLINFLEKNNNKQIYIKGKLFSNDYLNKFKLKNEDVSKIVKLNDIALALEESTLDDYLI